MKVHYLQHVPFEGPGYIETWLRENNHSISATRFYEPGYSFPCISAIDALIIMGGPMGVYDEYTCEWLHREKIFIEDCLQAGKKVLGICLGAQLMAVCLGAHVYTAANKEIGWFPVMPTEDAAKAGWLYELFKDSPTVLHWHGDKFDIPYDGSISLLSSAANNNQAFYHSDQVIGLQFHLEVTTGSLGLMLENCQSDLGDLPYIQTQQEILNGAAYIEQCNSIMGRILDKWSGAGT